MKNIVKTFLLCCLFFSQIIASGGSLYSRYGLGDLFHSTNAFQMSMGGLGISLNTQKYINSLNPASLHNISNTKLGAGLISYTSSLDDGTFDAIYSHVKFSGFNIAFPVERDLGIGFILGLSPYSIVNYNVVNDIRTANSDVDEEFLGTGGISKIFFGTSVLLPMDFALGATFNYYTGNIKYNSNYNYVDSLGLFDAYYSNEFKYKGLGATIGFTTPDLAEVFELDKISNFRIGAFYELQSNINTDSTISFRSSLGTNEYNSEKFDTKLPERMGIGLNFTINDYYLIVLDYLYQPWSKYEKGGLSSPYLKDLNRYSIGFQLGDETKRFASFWELIKYRGGLSYESSQYEINGEGINQLGLHAGVSFPLGLENSIDIGFMYGFRGKSDAGLVKENIFQLSFSLNFGEFWFIRQDR